MDNKPPRPSQLGVMALACMLAVACAHTPPSQALGPSKAGSSEGHDPHGARHWLAGDHHVHSQFSVDWDDDDHDPKTPPKAILGGDGIYPISKNAEMARKFGLSWMVSTDHGGPHHAKINRDLAYPELIRSRAAVPEVIQFYGMELDTPGADHSSLIIPNTRDERFELFAIESEFSKHEPWPEDPSRDVESRMIAALKFAKTLAAPPVLIANHPSRSATAQTAYGLDQPGELRDWNDAAPQVAIGMEGAPGHQASSLNPDGSLKLTGRRGGYEHAPTLGGFDPMTGKLGGFWDAMLGEGRAWRITSTSDSHRHYTEGGHDFWPGEYSKTYVFAQFEPADILDGLRKGRVFVTTGDLISELDIAASIGGEAVGMGGKLYIESGDDVTITIRVKDPDGVNAAGLRPAVARIDLIEGEVSGLSPDRTLDTNASTRVIKRFGPEDWHRDGEVLTMSYTLKSMDHSAYIRIRGTNTDQLEPAPDGAGEDPWSDLWFYSNPIFVSLDDQDQSRAKGTSR